MTNERERIEREIKRLEKELESPIDPQRRISIQSAINHLKQKKASWARPRGAMA